MRILRKSRAGREGNSVIRRERRGHTVLSGGRPFERRGPIMRSGLLLDGGLLLKEGSRWSSRRELGLSRSKGRRSGRMVTRLPHRGMEIGSCKSGEALDGKLNAA